NHLNANDPLGLCAQLKIQNGILPHAQFFFDPRLADQPDRPYLPPNAGFYSPSADPTLAVLGAASAPAVGVTKEGDDYQIAHYDDDWALWLALSNVGTVYAQQRSQFQLWDGHSLSDAYGDYVLDSPHFQPLQPSDLTHHDKIEHANQSNCQEFAYWVDLEYHKIVSDPHHKQSK